MAMLEKYGVEEMTFDEEIELAQNHPAQARTRSNKIRMQMHLDKIQNSLDEYREMFKSIPEEDDEQHSELVDELAYEIQSCMLRFTTAYDYVARSHIAKT